MRPRTVPVLGSLLGLGCFMVFISSMNTLRDVFPLSRSSLSCYIVVERSNEIMKPSKDITQLPVDVALHLMQDLETLEAIDDLDDESTKNNTLDSAHQGPPHPFAGARFPNGSFGYVADVYQVKRHVTKQYERHLEEAKKEQQQATRSTRNPALHPMYTFLPLNKTRASLAEPSEFDAVCNIPAGRGFERKLGYMLLMSRVQMNSADPPSIQISDTSTFNVDTVPRAVAEHPKRASRILCVIFTHGGALHRLEGIASTWGWRCDGFMGASTVTINEPDKMGFGSVDLPHEGEEEYGNMWQKTRSITAYLYENYMNDFEYFYLLGDDSHIGVENLRNYLSSVEQNLNITVGNQSEDGNGSTHDSVPLYIGAFCPGPGDGPDGPSFAYAGGGSGYLLNRAALRAFVEKGLDCYGHSVTPAEDRLMGKCLNWLGINLLDTSDDQNRQRFFGMDPNWIASFKGDHGYFARVYRYLNATLGLGFLTGNDIVSTQTIALHQLKKPTILKRIHAILYRACPTGTLLGDDQLLWDNYFIPSPLEKLK